MLSAVVSGKAAPGATTSTWALALSWPRPLLVADCDPAGGDMVPGMLAGRVSPDRGLLSWSTAARRDLSMAEATALLMKHAVQVPERPSLSMIPGFATATQGSSFTFEAWDRLAAALAHSADALGRDSLVDAGRLVSDRACWPVLRAADQVLVAVRPSVRSVHAAQEATRRLRQELGDLRTVTALVIGVGPYSAGEVTSALQLPLAGALPNDRTAAETLTDGGTASLKVMRRSPLMRSATSLAVSLAATTAPADGVEAVAG
jgi:hypothetical protein